MQSDPTARQPPLRMSSARARIRLAAVPPRLASGRTRLTDLAGGELLATIAATGSTVTSAQGQATIIEADLLATDGIIYVIDAVI